MSKKSRLQEFNKISDDDINKILDLKSLTIEEKEHARNLFDYFSINNKKFKTFNATSQEFLLENMADKIQNKQSIDNFVFNKENKQSSLNNFMPSHEVSEMYKALLNNGINPTKLFKNFQIDSSNKYTTKEGITIQSSVVWLRNDSISRIVELEIFNKDGKLIYTYLNTTIKLDEIRDEDLYYGSNFYKKYEDNNKYLNEESLKTQDSKNAKKSKKNKGVLTSDSNDSNDNINNDNINYKQYKIDTKKYYVLNDNKIVYTNSQGRFINESGKIIKTPKRLDEYKYNSYINKKGNEVIQFRDSKGKYIKKPDNVIINSYTEIIKTRNGKTSISYRDSKGRFMKSPKR